ncbi:uncharacterized protein B0H64DRAFT_370134 [Chaetomium fimeti]|uniref:Protein kinase domain-containing protein n=1 Tax=Chaetomium fimeti TaxID=1854472 RepID=A0AAE0HQN1_9PEZI|nr:hypothetical protein B0H64DRAFT_370134 [Chaetomium fimeti]
MPSPPPSPTKPVVPDLRPWSPPADPDKPPCPYRTGFTVDIKSHVPPAPFGGRDYGPGRRPMVSQLDLRTLKQTEIVMANPPLETEDPPVPRIHTLSVTRDLAVVDGRGAQLALCTIKPKDPVGHGPIQAVAKIYDPLYYSFPHPDVPSAVGQAGSFAPKYFGSWTFTVGLQMGKTTPPQSRSVRLILIEYIPGKSIRELCAEPTPTAAVFSEVYRLEVLARILDGVANLRFKGISQQDLAARNVIVHAPPNAHDQTAAQPGTIPRVVLIDYNFAVVDAETTHKRRPYAGTTLPPNPMRIYWKSRLEEFGSWIPAAWETNPRLRQEWLKKRFGGDNLARYAPIREELEFAAPPPPRARQPLTRELAKFPVNFWGDAAGDAVTGCNGGKKM